MIGIAYLVTIVLVNAAFAHLPLVSCFGVVVPPAAVLAGAVFVVRDLAQRQHGHAVLAYMGAGLMLSYVVANPAVAVASGVAFAMSEFLDWAIYTMCKGSVRRRIVLSSLIAVPVDTMLFSTLALGFESVTGAAIAVMVAAKLAPLTLVRSSWS